MIPKSPKGVGVSTRASSQPDSPVDEQMSATFGGRLWGVILGGIHVEFTWNLDEFLGEL